MNNWYLQDVYRAKERQEVLVKKYKEKKNINTFILRPKALSYGNNLYSLVSRKKLATEILKMINLT